ncbi:MAG TPA: hypothetical protein VFO73_12060, partial [Candidatus Limnocylindrales bacterium]|nr:hypothetical protein [Candidatus Limnocylindrales bacterium]
MRRPMHDAARAAGPPDASDVHRVSASARIDWFAKKGSQTERDRAVPRIPLPPPAHVHADRGRGHVTVSWAPAPEAVGYLVH